MLRHSGPPPHIGCCRCTHPCLPKQTRDRTARPQL